MKNGLRFRFDSETCLNYPFFDISCCRESEAKSQVVFQAKTQAKNDLLNWAPVQLLHWQSMGAAGGGGGGGGGGGLGGGGGGGCCGARGGPGQQ